MSLVTPRWWYLRGAGPKGLSRAVLEPASWAWTLATARRLSQGAPIDPPVPLVRVGNLTLGGSGKTPIVRALATRARRAGLDAHVLGRGHGGRLTGPARVDARRHSAAEVGDEALMMAADGPAWIARDRAAGVLAAAAAGAAVIIMDDGHQNPAVRPTISLLAVDGETRDGQWPFGDGRVFPAGPLREPLAQGLARADAVILLLPADLPVADPALLELFAGRPVLTARLEAIGPPPAGPQLGFAGVGKPWAVERALKAAGCALVDFAALPDHAALGETLLRRLADHAEALGAGLVTTEKDWVRLPPLWRERVRAWPVRARFEDEAALARLLGSALG